MTAVIQFDGFDELIRGCQTSDCPGRFAVPHASRCAWKSKIRKRNAGHPLQPGMLGKASYDDRSRTGHVDGQKRLAGPRRTTAGGLQNHQARGRCDRGSDCLSKRDRRSATGFKSRETSTPDDSVVLLGNERLRPGQKLQITRTSDEVPPNRCPEF